MGALMSQGRGWIQRSCLRVIEEYAAAGKRPSTLEIAAEVYRVEQDAFGNRPVTSSQHSGIRRALASLRRQSLVTGQQEARIVKAGGRKIKWRAERRSIWSLVKRQ